MTKKELKKDKKIKIKELKTEYRKNKKTVKTDYCEKLNLYYEVNGKPKPINPPKRSVLEEVGNAVTHGVGSIFSIVAYVLMCLKADSAKEYVGATMYFVGLFIMFTTSCLYHSFKYGTTVKRIFRRFDYSCIYLLIGATFAPILLCYLGGAFGITFLVIQWVIIVFGITMVAIFGPTKFRFVHVPMYLVLGWCGLMFLPKMISNGDYTFLWTILGGGIIYSIGVIPYALKKKAAHFIWHFFVLAGAVVQWAGVYICIYLK